MPIITTFSKFIPTSLQLFARSCIGNRDGKKQQREKNHQNIHVRFLDKSKFRTTVAG
jgi:hypothetical protein